MKKQFKIGTRGSPLALYQAELVKSYLAAELPLLTIEIVKIRTSGDMTRRSIPRPLETKRVFTKEIEDALLAGEVDMAVHSAKDLAADMPKGLKIGGVLAREDARDCLVARDGQTLKTLPLGARIGTASLRRKKQLLKMNPELLIEEVHGNVETRLRKLEEGHFDALILAYAGLKRLGLAAHASEILNPPQMYPAPGQGVIVVQTRESDPETAAILGPIHHVVTGQVLVCERAFLRRLEGGCQLPCGITSKVEGQEIRLAGILLSLEDAAWVEAEHQGNLNRAEQTGRELAEILLAKGGDKILEQMKRQARSRPEPT